MADVTLGDVDPTGVGDIRMLRTFRVAPGGELLPLSSSVAWRDGWNSAVCSRDSAHIPPARRCRCGFYGYWDPVSVMPSPAARHVLAVVAVHGELEIGSRGGRARYARIEALWLGARICAGLAQEVRLLYPTVMTYRDRDAMLTDFPIPRIAGLPAPRPGEAAAVHEGDTKSGKPRVVDLDPATVTVLRAWRKDRGSLALQLARDDAIVFGDVEGHHRNPEHVSRQFTRDQARCRAALGGETLPVIRLHDLRHTHATLLLLAREPVHVVSQRLGHASAVVTMTVYAHVLPGSQREAAARFAQLVREASGQ